MTDAAETHDKGSAHTYDPNRLTCHFSQDALKDLIAQASRPVEPQHDKLFAALAAAQGEIQAAEASQVNEHFDYRYANLQNCLDACREPLAKNELSVVQLPTMIEGGAVQVTTILGHSSGQSISVTMTMHPEKGGPQAIGSCITYLRRYMLCAIVGIGQQDDDANLATKDPGDYPRIAPDEAEAIYVKADELFGDKADDVISRMLRVVFERSDMPPIEALGDIPEGHAQTAMNALQNQWDRENPKPKTRAQAKPEKKPKPADKKPATDPDDDDVPT